MFKAQFTVEEILNTTKGKLWGEIDKDTIVSLSTDTRTITPEDAYIALCGKIFNGHDFVEKAFENGAKIAIINKDYFTNTSYPTIVVEDTTIAYLELARLHKNKQQAKIIAVTGSSGKTTTKELLYSVFNSKHKTQKSI